MTRNINRVHDDFAAGNIADVQLPSVAIAGPNLAKIQLVLRDLQRAMSDVLLGALDNIANAQPTSDCRRRYEQNA